MVGLIRNGNGTMTRIRVGIIGCGVIAPTHLKSYHALPEVEVTWVCDLKSERARRLAEAHGVAHTSSDAAQVFAAADVDAVSICTDHASHAALCEAALAAGKDVLCEKALAADREGLQRMCEAARRHPERMFGAVFQHRFDPVNRTVRALIAEGALGRMLTASAQLRCLRTEAYYRGDTWRGSWATEGGSVLINQAIHYVDQLLWQMGGVTHVAGGYANLTHGGVIETEDTAVGTMTFRNGALGTLEATCSSHLTWEPALQFQGTEGMIELRHDRLLRVSFTDQERQRAVQERLDRCQALDLQEGVGKSYYGTGHVAQIADFVEAVRTRRPPHVAIESAARTVELVLGLYESHRSGRRVAMP